MPDSGDSDEIELFMALVDDLKAIRSNVDAGRLDRGAGVLEIEHDGVSTFGDYDCDHRTLKSTGFVSEGESAYAVYFARWTEGVKSSGVSFLVSIYGWAEGSDETEKRLVAVHCHLLENGPGFQVLEAPDVYWGDVSSYFGQVMTRNDVVGRAIGKDVFDIVDIAIVDDPAVRAFVYDYDNLYEAARTRYEETKDEDAE